MNDLMNKNSLFTSPSQESFNEQDPKKHPRLFILIASILLVLFLLALYFIDFSSSETKLYQAMNAKDYEMIEKLIKNHVNINKKIKNGSFPLFDAILSGDVKLLRLFLENGADLTIRNNAGSTPLQTAVFMGNNPNTLEIIKLLKEFGANFHAEGTVPPLYVAALEGYSKILLFLLENGIDPDCVGINTRGQTPLHAAAYYGNTEAAKVLLNHKASVNIKDDAGKTPLDLALEQTQITNRFQAMKPSLSPEDKKEIQELLINKGGKKGSQVIESKSALKPLLLKDTVYLYPEKKMEINGSTISYIDEGAGEPIVFVHGLSTTLASFHPVLKDLIDKNYRVIALDLIGYGKSSKPDMEHSIENHSQNLILFLKKLGLQKYTIAGHSMGGAVSLLTALNEPELVSSLILLTPGGLEIYPPRMIDFIIHHYEESIGKRYSSAAVARSYFKSSFYQWNPEMEDFIKTRERQMLDPEWKKVRKTIEFSSYSFLQIGQSILNRIHSLKMPVLVLLGRQDIVVSSREIEENIKERVKNWTIKTYEKCGHMLQYDQNKKTVQDIDQFLKQNKSNRNI